MNPADLTRSASLFRGLHTKAPDAYPSYDMMSHALVWTDEIPEEEDPEKWWAIRKVLRHRTCLMLSETSEYEAWWLKGLELFPEWVGFAPERRQPSAELIELYRTSVKKSMS